MSKNKDNVLVKKNYYYILNILIAVVPIVYEIFLPLFGKRLGLQLISEAGTLIATNRGKVVEILVNVAVIVFIVWYNLAAEHRGHAITKLELDKLINDKEGLQGFKLLYSNILLSTFKICTSKYDTLLALIKETQANGTKPVEIVSDPRKQIKAIIEKITFCVATVTNVDESQLRTRVAYRFQNGEWTWLSGYASSGYFNIQNLQAVRRSTFNCVTRKDDCRENFIFFNKKSVAVKKEKYVYEPFRDIESDTYAFGEPVTEGSILAKSLFVGDTSSSAYAEMAIFIDTTDDCLLIKDDSKEALRGACGLLKNEIFANFEERLKIELALLYLKSLNTK